MNLKLRSADVRFILFILAILLLTFSKSFSATLTSRANTAWGWRGTWLVTKTGTISFATNTRTVTGSGTSFTTELVVGDSLKQTNNTLIGVVSSIASNTSLTLVANATSTLSAQSYRTNAVPTVNDAVTISSGNIITVNSTSTCASITFTAAAANNGITISGTNSLTVTGACTMTRPAGTGFNSTINVNAGTLTLGSLAMGGSSATRHTTINVTTGSCTISGNLTTATSGATAGQIINLTNSGSVTFTGTLVSISLTATTGTVNYNAAGIQTVRPTTYNNLTLGGSGAKTLPTGTTTINGNLKLEGSATVNIVTPATDLLAFGASAGIIYNKTTHTTSVEWPSPFNGTAGVTIQSGTVTLGAGETLGSGAPLIISNGATLTTDATNNYSLTLGGTVTNNGNFNPNSSLITYNSSSSQNIIPSNYYKLTLSNAGTKSITSATSVSNELNVNTGSTLATGGFLTLTSTSTSTARLGTATGTITGNVTVQRFIPGGSNKRKWRFLSSPVNVSGSIALSQLVDDILITAPAGSAAGFDVNPLSQTNTASLRTYDETADGSSNNGWTDPTDITNTISTGTGMEVFVRGTRGLANPYLNWTTPDDVTIDYVGALNTGTISPTITYTPSVGGATTADGFNLVGNPYASSIDFTNAGLTLTNVDDKFWSYNPNTGSYGIYDAGLVDSTNLITRYIASGQAFFVRANAASPAITFTEAIKVAAVGNNYFRNNANQSTHPILRISLSNDSLNADEALVVLDETATCKTGDVHDAGKLFNDALNVYTVSDDYSNLTINALPCIKNIDTIKVSVFSYNGSSIMTTPHHFEFSGMSTFPSSKYIYLKDEYTNTLVNLNTNHSYDFNITTDAASWGNSRFKLIFANSSLGINGIKGNEKIELFPNPASTEINLKFNTSSIDEEISYQIIDMYGKVIKTDVLTLQNQLAKINIDQLPSGQYFVNVISNTNSTTIRFVK